MIATGPPVTLPLACHGLGLRGRLDERGRLAEIGLGDRRHEQCVVTRHREADVGPLELPQARPLAHPEPVHAGCSRSAPAVACRKRCV